VEIDNEINRMKDMNVKYQLIENGKEKVGLVSELGANPFRILTSGVINGNTTNIYSLRFWMKEDAEVSSNQVFNVKIRLIATSKEALAEGKLVFGETIITSDSGVTSMTSDQLQTYVDRALGNKIETELNKQAKEYETKLAEVKSTTKKELLDENHPVGSIYISETNTNPSTLFGGTWVAYGQGRTLVGVGNGNDGTTSKSFIVGSTGGEYNHLLTTNEMPSHTHTQNAHSHDSRIYLGGYAGWQTGTIKDYYVQDLFFGHVKNPDASIYKGPSALGSMGITTLVTATNQNTGGGQRHNNIQPYITVYMWKRTK